MNFLPLSKPEPPPVIKANGAIPVPVMQPGITTAIETITPEVAQAYLGSRNKRNRNICKAAAIKYARDMQEGRWTLTGQAIIFDRNGRLIDGHHRLTAAADHKATFQSLVIRGVEPVVVTDIDGGRARTAADMAQMAGVTDPALKAAIAAMIILHERHGVENLKYGEKQPTKAEIIAGLKQMPDLEICCTRARSVSKLMAGSIGGFCYNLFRQQDRAKADMFWDELETGANLTKQSPVLHLRNRLMENRKGKAKLPKLEIVALVFKAWIAYRQGQKVKALMWRTNGAAPEPFPQI